MKKLLPLLLPLLLLFPLSHSSTPFPLSTNTRWIVDPSGRRVKLACANWPSHLDTMVAEGLGKQPVDTIARKIGSMGFNCVRLTWALFMMTNDTLGSTTVRQSFARLGLHESARGIEVNNPKILDLTVVETFKTVVSSLGRRKIMVVLDNHISTPGWCCSANDGNGFFGDQYFDPNLWIQGLTRVATMFNGTTNVIGMSLRNELRGPRENVDDWRKYMQMGAEVVHAANPNVLVILSGLHNDNDLSFLSWQQANVSFAGKLVFELHWYGFSDGSGWADSNPNDECGLVSGNVRRKAGFLLGQGFPLFVSEWGVDQRGVDTNGNRYLGCYIGLAAELDWDWSIWALQGSYYIREGVLALDEVYGVLAWDWYKIRNATFLHMVQTLQPPLQGPGVSVLPSYTILLHTFTGRCVTANGVHGLLRLGPCDESIPWAYVNGTLAPLYTFACLRANGVGQAATISSFDHHSCSGWHTISASNMHIASNLTSGDTVCLDVGGADGSAIVTNPCKCLAGDKDCDPEVQWFKMVNTTRSVTKRSELDF